METSVQIWNDSKSLAQIKEVYGKKLTDGEFSVLCAIGQATGLNPFMREVWAVKYGNDAAQIFIGRDGYRRVAVNHKDYDWHRVEAVYENDQYESKDGIISHSHTFTNRGKLLGAYCIVQRKGASMYIPIEVRLEEYNTHKSSWASKPETMIKKVAEAQALRAAFPEAFNGTYDESEAWEDKRQAKDYGNAIEVTLEPEIPSFKRGVEPVYVLTLAKVEELLFLLEKDPTQSVRQIDVKVASMFPGKSIYDLTKKEMEAVLDNAVRALENEKARRETTMMEEIGVETTEEAPITEPTHD